MNLYTSFIIAVLNQYLQLIMTDLFFGIQAAAAGRGAAPGRGVVPPVRR